MRSFIFFIIILFVNNLTAQDVSPYFPQKQFSPISKYETQMTYYELNFVNTRVQYFIDNVLSMTIKNNSTYDAEKGTITEHYLDKVAVNQTPKKLTVTYEVFPLDHYLIAKSVKISGNKALDFYVSYWNTTLNFEDVKDNEVVSNRYLQDRISYHHNFGDSYILVKNTTIENEKKFVEDFRYKQLNYKKEQDALALKKQTERKLAQNKKEALKTEIKIEAQQTKELRENTKLVTKRYKISKTTKKNKLELMFGNDDYANEIALETKLNEFLSEKKNGKYTVEVKYTVQYNKPIDASFNILYQQ